MKINRKKALISGGLIITTLSCIALANMYITKENKYTVSQKQLYEKAIQEIGNYKSESTIYISIGKTLNIKDITNTDGTFKLKEIENEEILQIDELGNITGISNGKTKIKFYINESLFENDIIVDVETSNATINKTTFNLSNCTGVIPTYYSSNKKKSNVTLSSCVKNYILKGNNQANKPMQNFAITNKYVYFSAPYNKTWANSNSEENYELITSTQISRTNRSGDNFKSMHINYSGHAQSFDVTANNESIFTNALAYIYQSEDRKNNPKKANASWGAGYRGVSYTTFKENGGTRIPGNTIIVKKDLSLEKIKSESFKTAADYYKRIKQEGRNINNLFSPEVAVDENNNKIALVSGPYVYVYDYNKFTHAIKSLKSSFVIDVSKQGVELDGDYLYVWTGSSWNNDNIIHTISKYSISKRTLIKRVYINPKDYKYNNERIDIEPEGISINNGKVYIGVVSRVKKGKETTFYNDIYLVNGI